ncbi:tail fiber assembly protein [Xenorhabdus szentirmaii]|uniref:tail fiber assembly protein n=1 Tax=Xenorhabdus szentirmaii TaxID=290112 RepID=UPI002B40F1F7|nr:tail fiber assembly protein [Xenorhabdus sp. ZM]
MSFYPVVLLPEYKSAGTLPDDVVPVSYEVFFEFSQSVAGKQRGVDANGMPCWVDIPPPEITPEQWQQSAEYQKRQLMNAATNAIAPLQYAVDLEMATNAEKITLTAWKKYCVLLNRVDCSAAPDIDWPKAPE